MRVEDTDREQEMRLCANPFRSHLVYVIEKLVFTILDANKGHISLLWEINKSLDSLNKRQKKIYSL